MMTSPISVFFSALIPSLLVYIKIFNQQIGFLEKKMIPSKAQLSDFRTLSHTKLLEKRVLMGLTDRRKTAKNLVDSRKNWKNLTVSRK